MEFKHFRLHDVKADDAARTIEGWASTFGNEDSDRDIIMPGAFTASLKERMPKMCWQHDNTLIPGIWDEAKESAQGLYVKGRILDTTLGNDTYKLVKAGAIDSMSIGYSAKKYEIDTETYVRTISEIELYEVSLVTFPANEQARITSVKSETGDFMTERQFEKFLRDVGNLGQEEAKTVVSDGYKALLKRRDGGSQLLEDTLNLFNQIKA